MSSENPDLKRFMDTATELGEQAWRKAFAPGGRSAGAGGRAAGMVSVANEGASGAADLARQMATIMLRTAIGIGEQVVEAAGQLESAVADQARDPSGSALRSASTGAREPAALKLPSASPGRTTSKNFDVRNDSHATVDGLGLRCDGLFGAGDRRIPGKRVTFTPVRVDVPPRETASVTCTVHVPGSAKRGTYTGLIEAAGQPGVELLVLLTVI